MKNGQAKAATALIGPPSGRFTPIADKQFIARSTGAYGPLAPAVLPINRNMRLPVRPTFADHDERRPGGWVGEALGALVDQCKHGAAQCLGATDLGSGFQLFECSLDQGDGRIAVDVPMRDKQGARAGIEEGARASPESASAPFVSPAAVLQADKITQSASSFWPTFWSSRPTMLRSIC